MVGQVILIKDIVRIVYDTFRNKSFNSRRISFNVPRALEKSQTKKKKSRKVE